MILLREMVKINFDLKKKHLLLFVGIIFIIGLGFVLAAIPNPGHGPSQVSIGGGKNLSDVTGQLIAIANGDYITAGSGLSVTQIGSQLNISLASGGGGITNVIAGIGLSGGGTTSTVTLNANCTAILGHTCGTDNVGLTVEADPKVGNTTNNLWCVGNGTAVICNRTAPTGSGISGSGTLNYIPKWNGTMSLTNSTISELNGNIGIGKTPGEKLDVAGNVSADYVKGLHVCIGSICQSSWPSGGSSQWNNSAYGIYYNGGNVGLGTNASSSYRLFVSSNPAGGIYGIYGDTTGGIAVQGHATNGMGIYGTSSTGTGIAGDSSSSYGVTGQSSSGKGVYGNSYYAEGVYAVSTLGYGVYCSGVSCGGNRAWTYTSDLRLKKNIQPIENALDKVLKLQGVTFQWKNSPTEKREMGFIAQDVLPLVPEVVTKNDDGYYAMQGSQLTALLVESIKEQQKQIAEQQKQIQELQKEVRALKAKI
jgi:hypothetical protein